jgi:hypothetical protein
MKIIRSLFILNYLFLIHSSSISSTTTTDLVSIIEDNKNNKNEEKEDSSSFDNLLIIGTADGMITAVDATNQHNEKWTLDTGGSIATSFNADESHYSVHPGIDGTVYIGNRQGMTKTSVKARMIAEKAPFVSNQDNLFFTGQKTNRILGVDVRNGKIIHDSSIMVVNYLVVWMVL